MSEMPFQLLAWIKREQEKERKHQEMMVKKNREDDKQYMRFISFLIRDWKLLNRKEKEMVIAFAEWYEKARNFTVKQRSAIAAMYMKHILDPKE